MVGRLRVEESFWRTVEAGAPSRDFFGLAYGREEGRYLGLRFGQGGSLVALVRCKLGRNNRRLEDLGILTRKVRRVKANAGAK